tara:strand:- start:401 stop:928 length:528 start_codon:yes stop_codon:yes gene_type:complete
MAITVSDVITGQVKTEFRFTRTDTQEIGKVENKGTKRATYVLTDGNSSGQSDLVFADTRTIAANTVETLNLLSLSQSTLDVTLPFIFRQLTACRVVNLQTTAGERLLFGVDPGRPTTVYAADVGPGCEFLTVNTTDSWVVTSTNSTVYVSNPNDVAISYELYLLGNATAVGGSGL